MILLSGHLSYVHIASLKVQVLQIFLFRKIPRKHNPNGVLIFSKVLMQFSKTSKVRAHSFCCKVVRSRETETNGEEAKETESCGRQLKGLMMEIKMAKLQACYNCCLLIQLAHCPFLASGIPLCFFIWPVLFFSPTQFRFLFLSNIFILLVDSTVSS